MIRRDRDARRSGLGELLLMDAMYLMLLATQVMAVHAIAVDAKDASTAKFYYKYGSLLFLAIHRGYYCRWRRNVSCRSLDSG